MTAAATVEQPLFQDAAFQAAAFPGTVTIPSPSSFLVLSPVLSGRARADSVSSAFSLPAGAAPKERRSSSVSSAGSGRFLRLNPVVNGRDEPIEEEDDAE